MANGITKRDLEELGTTLVEAMDVRFTRVERRIDLLEEKFETRFSELTETLDHFLKHLTDFDDEFNIMKSEVRRMKEVIKEKLGVDIDMKP